MKMTSRNFAMYHLFYIHTTAIVLAKKNCKFVNGNTEYDLNVNEKKRICFLTAQNVTML